MILIYFVLLFTNIVCIDIKISLGKKINDGNKRKFYQYPVVMTMYDNNNNNKSEINNSIDLICIYDINDLYSEIEGIIEQDNITFNSLKNSSIYLNSLDTIIDNLESNDRFTLILFSYEVKIIKYREKIENKTEIKNIINENITNLSEMYNRNNNTNYTLAFEKLANISNKILNETEENNKTDSLVHTVFFITNENDKYYKYKINNNYNFNFSLYIFSFNFSSYQSNFVDLSFSSDGAFFPICYNDSYSENNKSFVNYIQKTINDTRKVKYKMSNITIESKYEISCFYGRNFIPTYSIIGKNNTKISFLKFQFITGKEYVYVFQINLPNNISFGESILNVKINYTYLNGRSWSSSKLLKYHNSIKYFDFTKVEFCKALLVENITKRYSRGPITEFNEVEGKEKITNKNFTINNIERFNDILKPQDNLCIDHLNLLDICENISIDIENNSLSIISFLREYFQK